MNSIIDIQHVTRKFKDKPALDDVTLRQEKGTVLGLVGENGAGKTTHIKTLLGLLKPDQGAVRVFGRDSGAIPSPSRSRCLGAWATCPKRTPCRVG